ncbi:unnamed protein product [Amoebophrya sp. A25]|nr:unnamed protein product [Amoebophrya sp. A25]|eukprot:GSA25T00019961001.1
MTTPTLTTPTTDEVSSKHATATSPTTGPTPTAPKAAASTFFTCVCAKPGSEGGSLGLIYCDDEIVAVVPKSWAMVQDIDQGDMIVAVNDKKFKTMSPNDRKTELEKPGVRIEFERPATRAICVSGILVDKNPGCRFKGRKVVSVSEKGFASTLEIAVDDELVAVNGTGYTELAFDEKLQLLTKTRPVEMIFRRAVGSEKTQVRVSPKPVVQPSGGFFAFCTVCAEAKRGDTEQIVV